jgi:hypothetical protein
MNPSPTVHFDPFGRFILKDYQQARPFSSFLPGIAGTLGIPLWAFYVNRGQVIASFGVESKDRPIMEFQPANKAYQQTSALGFRTFLRWRRGNKTGFYEPFGGQPAKRVMFIGMNEVEIRETNPALGLETSVLYFILPNQPFAAFARLVTFRNLSGAPIELEALDGLPAIIPYGTGDGALKNISRTIEAWMEVAHLETRIPFYKLRASAGDSAEVTAIQAGNFALAFSTDGELLPPLVDPMLVFGHDTAFTTPTPFTARGLDSLLNQTQICEGRTPCAFFGTKFTLDPEQSQTVTSLYGMVDSFPRIESRAVQLASASFFDTALTQARSLTHTLTDPIATQTASPLFDAYCRQTFLDNVMRGGFPLILGGRHVYHVYSRKHGDMERDYNHFVLAAEHYSQGNGNYRDVNQNRRCDVFFEPRVGDFNIRTFASLIQSDGYNPLVVQGTVFSLPAEKRVAILTQVEHPKSLEKILAAPFTPGKLLTAAQESGLRQPPEEFIENVLAQSQQHIHAEFGEGYWVDHWTYVLDLLDSYLAIYSDKKTELLFDSEPLPFFDSAEIVLPRHERYVLSGGKPRQLNTLRKDPEKAALIASRTENETWARSQNGRGGVFRLNLFGKLSLLAILKFATCDPFGMGIEMEAGRPGWYDALNGLPGMFGSSMPETFELLRLVEFLLENLEQSPRETELPREAEGLLEAIHSELAFKTDDLSRWNTLSDARESYRAATRLGFAGETIRLTPALWKEILLGMRTSLEDGIRRAAALTGDIPPTYLACEPVEYDVLQSKDAQDRPFINVKSFQPTPLPAFLEGAVRAMKILSSNEAEKLHEAVRASDLYDCKLGMYRVNVSLEEQPHHIGRARAFSPGWLENGSIWLHMSYKYLLELLRAGLYEEFFAALPKNLVPFMDPAVYGRSPLENSSFIVSSAHPDESLHGAGFVARLSGSTAEFLSMWQLMMTGPQPFIVKDGELHLALRPILPAWMFDADESVAFRFLGNVSVKVLNTAKLPTWELQVSQYTLTMSDGEAITIKGETVPQPYSGLVRDGQIKEMVVRTGPLS